MGHGICHPGLFGLLPGRYSSDYTTLATGDNYLNLITNLKVAATLRMQGRLQEVMTICQKQMRLADESGLSQTVVVGWLLAIWGEVLVELNELDGALIRRLKGWS